MPTISIFWGIIIQMWWNDHNPPNFHCKYGNHQALIDIQTLTVLKGDLPKRLLNGVLEWAALHQAELIENWHLCQKNSPPNRIKPLE